MDIVLVSHEFNIFKEVQTKDVCLVNKQKNLFTDSVECVDVFKNMFITNIKHNIYI